jgi:hypothetical protein
MSAMGCMPSHMISPLPDRGGRVRQEHQHRENPARGGNPAGAGAEGATAPVNSQAQRTVAGDELWRVARMRPPKG